MTDTTYSAAPTFAPSSGASARSIIALVLSILGLLSCWLLSPVAWYLGRAELADIRMGVAPKDGEAVATIAVVLGVIGTVFLGLVALAIVAVLAFVVTIVAVAA